MNAIHVEAAAGEALVHNTRAMMGMSQLKVTDSVILPIAVDMVNLFFLEERSSDIHCHYQPMLQDVPTGVSHGGHDVIITNTDDHVSFASYDLLFAEEAWLPRNSNLDEQSLGQPLVGDGQGFSDAGCRFSFVPQATSEITLFWGEESLLGCLSQPSAAPPHSQSDQALGTADDVCDLIRTKAGLVQTDNFSISNGGIHQWRV